MFGLQIKFELQNIYRKNMYLIGSGGTWAEVKIIQNHFISDASVAKQDRKNETLFMLKDVFYSTTSKNQLLKEGENTMSWIVSLNSCCNK